MLSAAHRSAWRLALGLGVGCASLVLTAAGQDQRPVFRSTSDLVAVPVAVERGNAPVADLKVADFELRDNGVIQRIELVADGTSPIDLTVVVDTSGSVGWQIEQFRRDIERLPELLTPNDRVRVLAFDLTLRELVRWTSGDEAPVFLPIVSGGRTALNDAVAASLMAEEAAEGRRPFVAVLMGGPDNLSGVDMSRVLDLAGRANVALYTYESEDVRLGIMPGEMDRAGNMRSTMRAGGRISSAVFRTVQVRRETEERRLALEQAAERTGGRPRDYKNSAFDSLRDLVEEFRHTYVLYFRPSNSVDDAWHDLGVEIRRAGGPYTVHARPGYLRSHTAALAAPVPSLTSAVPFSAPAASPPSEPPGEPVESHEGVEFTADMVPALLDRYSAGEFAEVVGAIRGMADIGRVPDVLKQGSERWIEDGTTGSASMRRGVAAALALDVASPTWEAADTEREHFARQALIFWGAELFQRNLAVSDVERTWYLAANAMLHAGGYLWPRNTNAATAAAIVDQAVTRVPDEGRHRWSHARVLEWKLEAGVVAARTLPADIRMANEAALARADGTLRAEIVLNRVSSFLYANANSDEPLGPIVSEGRRAAAAEAIARTTFAEGLTSDEAVLFMCRFLRGRLHDRLDQRTEAEAAYRSALQLYPHAQSASMPLATLLFLKGDARGARDLIDGMLAAGGAADPWRGYPLGDRWRLPTYIAEMRAAISR